MGFVHLHLHSHYSIMDSTNTIDKILAKVKSFGMKSVAITDRGNLFGVIDFYTKATQAGIKPIIGAEVSTLPLTPIDRPKIFSYQLVLLAKNNEGYRNLINIVSHPRVDRKILKKNSNGLIALSGSWAGEIPSHVHSGNYDKAKSAAIAYQEIFGIDSFYIELIDSKLPGQEKLNEGLRKLSEDLKFPIVAANDCHYTNRDDSMAYEVLKCVHTGKLLADNNNTSPASSELYIKSPEEMLAGFKGFEVALTNTVKIAKRRANYSVWVE